MDRLKQIWVPESVLGVLQCASSRLIVKYDQGFGQIEAHYLLFLSLQWSI